MKNKITRLRIYLIDTARNIRIVKPGNWKVKRDRKFWTNLRGRVSVDWRKKDWYGGSLNMEKSRGAVAIKVAVVCGPRRFCSIRMLFYEAP